LGSTGSSGRYNSALDAIADDPAVTQALKSALIQTYKAMVGGS
jgi:hypothetical protein